MFKQLRETINAYKMRDPAARSSLEIFLLYPGVAAVIYHRLAHWYYRHGLKFLARWTSQWNRERSPLMPDEVGIGGFFVASHLLQEGSILCSNP